MPSLNSGHEFRQRHRSGESPKDVGRVRETGDPLAHKRLAELKEAGNIPSGLGFRSIFTEAEREAITRKYMNTPVYPSRARAKSLQASRGGKPLPHPLRSAE